MNDQEKEMLPEDVKRRLSIIESNMSELLARIDSLEEDLNGEVE